MYRFKYFIYIFVLSLFILTSCSLYSTNENLSNSSNSIDTFVAPDIDTTLWQRYINLGGLDTVYSGVIDKDGNIILVGSSYQDAKTKLAVVKLNNKAELLFKKTFSYSYEDVAYSVDVDKYNNYVIAGKTYTSYKGFDFLILKLDSNGNLLWKKTYDFLSGYDVAYCIKADRDSNIVVAGYVQNTDSRGYDVRILKLAHDGNIIFSKVLDLSKGDDIAYSIAISDDNKYAILSTAYNTDTLSDDIWLLIFSDNGKLLVNKTYDYDLYDDSGRSIAFYKGKYMISGFAYSYDDDYYGLWALKVDSSGRVLYSNIYKYGFSSGEGISLTADRNADFFVLTDLSLFFKLDYDGDLLWYCDKYKGIELNCVFLGNDNNFFVAGSRYSDFYLIKLENRG